MKPRAPVRAASAFDTLGIKRAVAAVQDEIRELYLGDQVPWIVGYSGGKDSTTTLQLVWEALAALPLEQRKKTVHVISTDTLVENPIVASWVTRSLEVMRETAERLELPVVPSRLTPEVTDSFWVNLIGRGYPAPRPKFRWCTERLKIKPSNAFIRKVVRDYGEAILVLGTRKAESQARARSMSRHERRRVRERLSPNAALPNSLVYSPIEDWSNDDVWLFLMQHKNPWGYDNKDLLTMYQGASPDGECPLVVDSSTPSCGDSRFGCWVCTLVERDKSMQAMIQNDEEKEWMLPLLELRNALDIADDSHLRDFRRIYGAVEVFEVSKKDGQKDLRIIRGPYTQEAREMWLRRVLEAQRWIRDHGPKAMGTIELISAGELQEIRRIWVVEKHEFEDRLPRIYAEAYQETCPLPPLDRALPLGEEEVSILREVCGDDTLHFALVRDLLDIERQHQYKLRRSGLWPDLEKALKRGFYDSEEDAVLRARARHSRKHGPPPVRRTAAPTADLLFSDFVQPVAGKDGKEPPTS